jgi:hypothetical protein
VLSNPHWLFCGRDRAVTALTLEAEPPEDDLGLVDGEAGRIRGLQAWGRAHGAVDTGVQSASSGDDRVGVRVGTLGEDPEHRQARPRHAQPGRPQLGRPRRLHHPHPTVFF